MTHSSKRTRDRFPVSTRGTAVALAVLVAVSLLGITACDTVARIPFSDRNFQTIAPGAMNPAGDSCEGIVGGNATKTMVFIDNFGEPIKHQEEVSLDFVDPGRDDVGFNDNVIFAFPDVTCGSDADCPTGTSCRSASGGANRCQTDTSITADSAPRFSEANEPESQALVMAIADAGPWRGWYSSDLAGYYEFDPDQSETTGHQLSSTPVRSLAVDPDNRRGPAFNQLAGWWGDLQNYVDEDERDAYFGLWTFGESRGEVRSRMADVHQEERTWSSNPSLAEAAVGEIPRDPDAGRTNVYESMYNILDDAFDSQTVQAVDTANVVVVVPSHDEVRSMDADDVVAKVNDVTAGGDIDVSVTIIQVDSARDVSEIPDDWAYYTGEGADQAPCSSDDDCQNFETCREPTWYVDDPNAISEDDVVFPREDERGETFCMPDHDENGRIGPVADYARIACETGGAYHYLSDISRQVLEEQFRAQVWNLEANWELDVTLDDELDGQANFLQTTMDITIGNERSYDFERDSSGRDRRRVFFTPEQ